MTKQIDPLSNETTYEYDDAGKQTFVTQSCGVESKTCYDSVVRITKSQNGNNSTEYLYDSTGHRTLIQDALGNETTFEFDCLGRKTLGIPSSPFSANTASYEYDDEGRQNKMTKPDSTFITYEYNDMGHQTRPGC